MHKTNFIGEAGEHFVAYKLAIRELYVGLTLGNMPNIDLLLSANNGLKSISIQIKTSQGAYRKNRYGIEGYEWDVNKNVIGRSSLDFWYVLVDFKYESEKEPDVYIIPSKWVAEFVLPGFTRYMYFLPKEAADLTRNRWDFLEKALSEEKETLNWASKWDDNLLVRWGKNDHE